MSLVGMCNPLLDISADVPMELFEKYGVTLNNAILAEGKHVPLYDEMVKNYPVLYIAGGAGQNSIRVAQWMLQIPNKTAYFGAVGDDAYGNQLAECAAADGVNACYQRHATEPTGTCAVLVNSGERSLVANLAAANTFSQDHLDTPAAKAIIEAAEIYYVTSFFLTVSIDSILTLANDAATNNKVFSMNLSAPFLIQVPPFWEGMQKCIPFCDFVFANESEAEAYGEAKGWGKDIQTIALKLAAEPKQSGTRARTVVFTQGKSNFKS